MAVSFVSVWLITYGLEIAYSELAEKQKSKKFYNGLNIAQLESAVEFLGNCSKAIAEDRVSSKFECDYASEQFAFQMATLGKSSLQTIKMDGNYVAQLAGIDKAAYEMKAYSFMQTLLNSQIRRSKNAMLHDERNLSDRLIENFLDSPFVTVFVLSFMLLLLSSLCLRAKNAHDEIAQ